MTLFLPFYLYSFLSFFLHSFLSTYILFFLFSSILFFLHPVVLFSISIFSLHFVRVSIFSLSIFFLLLHTQRTKEEERSLFRKKERKIIKNFLGAPVLFWRLHSIFLREWKWKRGWIFSFPLKKNIFFLSFLFLHSYTLFFVLIHFASIDMVVLWKFLLHLSD